MILLLIIFNKFLKNLDNEIKESSWTGSIALIYFITSVMAAYIQYMEIMNTQLIAMCWIEQYN